MRYFYLRPIKRQQILWKVRCASKKTLRPILQSLKVVDICTHLLRLARWLTTMPAPLRRIVAREVSAFQPDSRNKKYLIYSLIDTLECGHSHEVYLYNGLQDIIFAYTDSPAVSAKRHRCRPCEALLAKKKPQSVPLPAVAKTA